MPVHRLVDVLYGCLLEARPVVQGIFLLRFFVGASFADPLWEEAENLQLWLGAAAWAFVTLSVYLVNGLMDVEEDTVNGSVRPLAGGRLSVRAATVVAAALAVAGTLGAWAVDPLVGLGAAVALALGWLYSGPPVYLKRWPAGLAGTASLGGLLTYLAGYQAHGGAGGTASDLFAFALVMSAWMGLVGQTKDLPDEKGDRAAGRRSLPVVWGAARARRAYSVAAVLLALGLALYSWVYAPELRLSAAVVALGAIAVTVLASRSEYADTEHARRRPYQAFMASQYVANAAIMAI